MTSKENAKSSMYQKVKEFLSANATSFTGFTRLTNEINNFNTLTVTLNGFVSQQVQNIKGITGGKDAAFIAIITPLVNIARKALVWAKDNDNQQLIAVFDIRESDFTKPTQNTALEQAKNIRDRINANIVALAPYNILPADVTTITTAITAFEGMAASPGVAISSKKTATNGIKNTINDIDASLSIIDDLIKSEYGTTQPDLVNEYLNNRSIDNKGVRHTGLSVLLTDSVTNLPIENGKINIDTIGKSATTDINGAATISPMKAGTYNVSFSAADYTEQIIQIVITRGKIITKTVQLVAIAH